MKLLDLKSEIFTRGVEDVVTKEELSLLLKSGRKLRVKHGIDATAPDLHLGHAANLWKLRTLQEAGHKAVILFGDVTTGIGDPTGRVKARPVLTVGEIRRNIESIEKQIKKVLLVSPSALEVRKSSEWYKKLNTIDFLKLLSMVTNARILGRDMFKKRMKEGGEIHEHEIVYPVLQGYDSVMLRSDLTIIGSDQLFNEHLGRHFQERFKMNPQVIVTLKILPGLDGGEKMSKSLGNHISILDSPRDKFGKAMRQLDSLIIPYLESYTDVPMAEISDWRKDLAEGRNPMEAKLFFAEELVKRYHGRKVAQEEREKFIRLFSERKPDDVPEVRLNPGRYTPVQLLLQLKAVSSRSEARRLLKQKAVEINGSIVTAPNLFLEIHKGIVVRVGKHRFVKIK